MNKKTLIIGLLFSSMLCGDCPQANSNDNQYGIQQELGKGTYENPKKVTRTNKIKDLFKKLFSKKKVEQKIEERSALSVIFKGIAPYEGGYPSDLEEAIDRASGLMKAIRKLHKSGFVHTCLSLYNVTIENKGDSFETYPCKITDSNLTKKIGEPIMLAWGNVAPEFFIGIPATTAFDVYAAGTVLPNILFGKSPHFSYFYKRNHDETIPTNNPKLEKFYKMAYGEYTMSNPKIENYEEALRRFRDFHGLSDSEFTDSEINEYFIQTMFTVYNKLMFKATGRQYDTETIEKLAQLVAKMLAKNPAERPSAAEVENELENISNSISKWNCELNFIDLEEYQKQEKSR